MRQAQVFFRVSAELSVKDQLEEFADQLDTLVGGHTPYNVEQLEPLLEYESKLLLEILDALVQIAVDAVSRYSGLSSDHPYLLEAQEHLAEVNKLRDALEEGRYVKLP